MKKAKRLVTIAIILALASIAVGIIGMSVESLFDNDFSVFRKIALIGLSLILAFLCFSGCILTWQTNKEDERTEP